MSRNALNNNVIIFYKLAQVLKIIADKTFRKDDDLKELKNKIWMENQENQLFKTEKNEKNHDFKGQVKAGSGKSNMKGVRV